MTTTTRRGRGEGSLYFDKDRGLWTGQVTYRDPATGKRVYRQASDRTKSGAASQARHGQAGRGQGGHGGQRQPDRAACGREPDEQPASLVEEPADVRGEQDPRRP